MTASEFTEKFGLKLNKAQIDAVGAVNGSTLLLAVPGSGKTTVIVSRLGYMVYCLGISPEKILTMTYTVSATRDMKNRFIRFFGDEYADRLEFRTINGVCAVIINYYSSVLHRTPFRLLTDEKEIFTLLRELYIRTSKDYPSDSDIKEVRTKITYCKNMMLSDAEIKKITVDGVDFAEIYRLYCSFLSENKLMDYDDQGVIAYRILKKYPTVLEYFRNKYSHINVDEAQDTSKIQHMIIRLLTQKQPNIFMVGDEDQSIYGFRAAYPRALLEFDKVYQNPKVLLMEENYRSTSDIVEKADCFIGQNINRHNKKMISVRGKGNPVVHTVLEDYGEQYKYLMNIAKTVKKSTAVLFRNNDSILPIVDLFEKNNISYCCKMRETSFFSHYILRDIKEFFAFTEKPWDSDIFLNIFYKFDLRIRKETILLGLNGKKRKENALDKLCAYNGLEDWQKYRLKSLRSGFENLLSKNSFSAVNTLVNIMGYGNYLSSRNADTSKINILLSLARQNENIDDFFIRLDELKNLMENGSEERSSKFILSTVHSAKGLEYDRVIIIDVLDGIFPSVIPSDMLSGEEEELLEEERRLFYVAATRAKNQLELITYKNKFGTVNSIHSSFIESFMGIKAQKPVPKVDFYYKPKGETDVSSVIKDYTAGTAVIHKSFGKGVITAVSGTICSVSFNGKIRTIDLSMCIRNQIIGICF